jgi:hypothetical protein
MHPIERKAASNYNSLTKPERVWYTVTRLIFCVRDGGLISYYYNGYATSVDDLVPALDLIGAKEAKALVLRMNSLFGARVPKSLEGLNATINGWSLSPQDDRFVNDNNDAEQRAVTEAETLLAKYVSQHGIEP